MHAHNMPNNNRLPPDFGCPSSNPTEICVAAKQYLSFLHEQQFAALGQTFAVEQWIKHQTQQIDRILCCLYHCYLSDVDAALFAIGGYGREELFPRSDIDILLLCDDDSIVTQESISAYIQALWSLGLDIAQSVRTRAQCLEDAKKDTDMLTSLVEARFLAGQSHYCQTVNITHPRLISPRTFLELKLQEQQKRDEQRDQIGKLEPNIKTGTGGLRDIQMISWVYRYCLHPEKTQILLEGLLTPAETQELIESRRTLWKIRFALHLNTKQHKDRLSFEQQKQLAQLFHYPEGKNNQAVESFMREYYLATLRVRRLNRLAIKLIDSQLRPIAPPERLDAQFSLVHQRLVLNEPKTLIGNPRQLWQIFLHLLNNPLIDSISPQLGRQLREYRDRIFTASNRHNKETHQGFLTILNHQGNVHRQIRRMHRYGLLSRYLPAFLPVVGRMQYDLFHQYTVDQHTLRLIYFLEQFKTYQPDYPATQDIMRRLRSPAILYLAALFHDIGKGHLGDHSEIGAAITIAYLEENTALSREEGKLLVFLVRHHLLLSATAQKKDLSDPSVIKEFAAYFPNSEYLDYLYLLTLADISATNNSLWNSWRANLMYTLYRLTANHLNTFTPHPQQQIDALKQRALSHFDNQQAIDDIHILWQQLPNEFFINETPNLIAEKTRLILITEDKNIATLLQNHPPRLFISATGSPDILFARITHFMEKQNFTILEARLYRYGEAPYQRVIQQYTLADYCTLSPQLLKQLNFMIAGNVPPKPLGKRLHHTPLKHFSMNTHIHYHNDGGRRTVLELTCKDRHGLLSLISRIFLEQNIHLNHAKIATFGEKVEDTFYLTDAFGYPLTAYQQTVLSEQLYQHLK
ncbi:[protein-PII] uridylyltransferase [Suttonella ornithocola]|uniref:Bifunctional uridylyltransferase/uridylyl-removing enzyme n=1 Tax=Suttonella ornithocola TaxID=279832 RepID=A0A380MKG2_9GAMM|nr:[protein-PII] uridylyltransferase [Suttonella ornithocola]SUO93120.1 PII uridylyl-transferase [Suttonella ornithocola]